MQQSENALRKEQITKTIQIAFLHKNSCYWWCLFWVLKTEFWIYKYESGSTSRFLKYSFTNPPLQILIRLFNTNTTPSLHFNIFKSLSALSNHYNHDQPIQILIWQKITFHHTRIAKHTHIHHSINQDFKIPSISKTDF